MKPEVAMVEGPVFQHRRVVLSWLTVLSFTALPGCTQQSSRILAAAAHRGDVRHGEYLTTVFCCRECHTVRQADGVHLDSTLLFTGGVPFGGTWGLVHAANVTIASQYPAQVIEGIVRGRLAFKFQMPTDLYNGMAADDMQDIIAYLKTLRPIRRPLPDNHLGAGFVLPAPNPPVPIPEHAPKPGTLERSRYLARVFVCQDCHSPRAPGGGYDQEHFFGGGGFTWRFADGRLLIPPNLTPDRETGLGAWSDTEIIRAIRTGVARDGHQLDPGMPYLVAFHDMTDQDAADIVRFLRSLRPVQNSWPNNPRYSASDLPVDCCFAPPPNPAWVRTTTSEGNR
ncbi:MAG: c-type cytochrome [Bryobacteraceae bacterium]